MPCVGVHVCIINLLFLCLFMFINNRAAFEFSDGRAAFRKIRVKSEGHFIAFVRTVGHFDVFRPLH